ncbi:MAG: electron transfer flavoprotein subunit beta/FixA family protein [Candidatus Riflebacteria bacterium]|nr:electron transfer flavoprotein subunit beta/FixA family protein [Candidatus Riflebacteria bacterium]
MNIFVCIKQVPDTAQPVKISPDGTALTIDGVEMVINPYDEYAIEEALRIKEKLGRGLVTLVTVGPARCQKALRSGLALGADEAVHLMDPVFEGSDQLGIARILAAFLKTQQYGLILTGKQAVDDDTAMVPQALASLLGLPILNAAQLGLDAATVGAAGVKVKLRKLAYPEAKRGGTKMLQGDKAAQVGEAVRILREELKIV